MTVDVVPDAQADVTVVVTVGIAATRVPGKERRKGKINVVNMIFQVHVNPDI